MDLISLQTVHCFVITGSDICVSLLNITVQSHSQATNLCVARSIIATLETMSMQNNSVKMGFQSGWNVVFTAYEPDGTVRGLINQPLPETTMPGYYSATPLTDLVVGDVVLVYQNDQVYWESDPIYISTEDFVYYEGVRVTYEENWVYDFDTLINDLVTSIGYTVGSAEYSDIMSSSTDVIDILANTNELVENQHKVTNVFNEVIPLNIQRTEVYNLV